ncbi:hypothetical protein GCM10028818_15640 [Spirosoma horti]
MAIRTDMDCGDQIILEKVFKKFNLDSREGINPVFDRLRLTIGWIAYMAKQIN